ncbi:MAG: choice-of-anchor K domain-containing protein [Candidatus Electronema sp. V4]|uniref:choice-of-anchor K domain-containing protein n=1 Tax=Candidatus Electronema sp. V4 TaxID=3454756 RepID=UPI0040557071
MATVTTSGIWTSVKPQPDGLQGVGTNKVRWGTENHSGYDFEGVSNASVPVDGTEFKLGTFTHHNRSLTGTFNIHRFAVILALTLDCADGSASSSKFHFTFNHHEIGGADDTVEFPSLKAEEQIAIADTNYTLHLTGFQQNGQRVIKFVSKENSSNSAEIFAKLVPVKADSATTGGEPVKMSVDVGTVFAAALERLNRRSVIGLLEQLADQISEHCEKIGICLDNDVNINKTIEGLRQNHENYLAEISNINNKINSLKLNISPVDIHNAITGSDDLRQFLQQTFHDIDTASITNQINELNAKLLLIKQEANELGEGDLHQVQVLIEKMIQKIDMGKVISDIKINVNGRDFDLAYLLNVLVSSNQIANLHISYSDTDLGDITEVIFILADRTRIPFRPSNPTVTPVPGIPLTYLFSTNNWKGVPAQFSLTFKPRPTSFKLCNRTLTQDFYDGVEQSNIVFDLLG